MSFTFSPTALTVYGQCPLRFWGMYVIGELPRPSGYPIERGKRVHYWMDFFLRKGWDDRLITDRKVNTTYVRILMGSLFAMRDQAGYRIHSELPMAIRKNGKACAWDDENCFLRARADALLAHDDPARPVIIGDFKTGNPPTNDFFQLRAEAFLAHILYARTKFDLQYWYVDDGRTERMEIDLSDNLYDVNSVLGRMHEVQDSLRNNFFPATPNRYCQWCDWDQTPTCLGG